VRILDGEKFGITLSKYGNSLVLVINEDIRETLEIDINKPTDWELHGMVDKGKHGKYLALWKA